MKNQIGQQRFIEEHTDVVLLVVIGVGRKFSRNSKEPKRIGWCGGNLVNGCNADHIQISRSMPRVGNLDKNIYTFYITKYKYCI